MPSEASKRIRATFRREASTSEQSIEEGRRSWEESAAQAPLPPGARFEPLNVAGVACAWVRYDDSGAGVLLFMHGGGFNAGSAVTHRELGARLAQATNMPVLLVDYRLAPEHPFPAGLEDVQTVYRALLEQGYAAHDIVVGGDSAGGGLAVSALLALRDAGVPLPRAAVLMSAWLDLALAGDSFESRAHVDPLASRQAFERAVWLYIGERDPADSLISPVYAALGGLPPMLVQVGDHEVLLDDSRRLAERGRAAGVNITLEVWPEMWHVWHASAAELPEAQAAIERIGAFVRARHAGVTQGTQETQETQE